MTGCPPAPSVVIGSSVAHKVMQTPFSSLPHRAVFGVGGRILQVWHQPVKLAQCPNRTLLQHCKSQCYGLPLTGCSQPTVFPNQGTRTRRDLAAAQLAVESASRDKRSGTRKRLSSNPIVAPPSVQIRFETALHCFKSVLLT